jgi:hypothetical protein
MSEAATLDQEGAPGMDALNEGQEPTTPITDPPADGAPAEEAGQDERPKSKHELAMEAVAANRLKDLEEETGQVLSAATPGAADELGTLDTDQAPRQLRLVKVDGQEIEVSDDDLIREYQKGRTADRRLERAADERKRNEAESATLAAERAEIERMRTAGGTAKPAGSEEDSQATPFGDDEAAAKKIYEDLVSGDEEAAVKAIKNLTKGRQAEAIPPEVIAARVRQQIQWEDAQGAFAKDYADIAADPLLRQIASNTLTETLKTSTSFGQAFREAGERTRAWVRGVNGGSAQAEGGQPPADPGQAEKLARKERIDNPTAINARAAGKPQETVASPSAVIKEMRQARGLPT